MVLLVHADIEVLLLDDGTRAAITACGSGRLGDAQAVLDELLR